MMYLQLPKGTKALGQFFCFEVFRRMSDLAAKKTQSLVSVKRGFFVAWFWSIWFGGLGVVGLGLGVVFFRSFCWAL